YWSFLSAPARSLVRFLSMKMKPQKAQITRHKVTNSKVTTSEITNHKSQSSSHKIVKSQSEVAKLKITRRNFLCFM
ncbi:MAG TPA: hypothetical protein VGC73_06250, partial [Pyrinomonadaceae bacterium]